MNNSTIFAKNASPLVSNRYKFIDTTAIVSQLEAAGFVQHRSRQSRSNKIDGNAYGKHLISFRHATTELKNVGDTVPELILRNSHDGSSCFQFDIGIFRLVCSNGLVLPTSLFATMKVKHVGQAQVKIAELLPKFIDVMAKTGQIVDRLKALQVDSSELVELKKLTGLLRLPENAFNIDTSTIGETRRQADTSQDLWTVFNRMQETLIRGGIKYQYAVTNELGVESIKNATTKRLSNIDNVVNLNKVLFEKVIELAEIKEAA